jgi:hypothetical protein
MSGRGAAVSPGRRHWQSGGRGNIASRPRSQALVPPLLAPATQSRMRFTLRLQETIMAAVLIVRR